MTIIYDWSRNRKARGRKTHGPLNSKSGGDLLSHTATYTAIGAGGLNDCVKIVEIVKTDASPK
jgi:hypothetical protein